MQSIQGSRTFSTDEERPLTPEEAGDFKTETFNQWVYDPVSDVGMNIWFASGENGGGQGFPNFLATIILFVGGERYTNNSVGKGNHEKGIAAGNAFLTVIEPFKRLKIDFLGLLTRQGGTEAPHLSRLDLVVDIRTPPVEQGSQGDTGEAPASGPIARTAIRYEQLCHIAGTVSIGDKVLQVDALGMRSHRRNSASIYASGAVGHTWATALFPSGHGFHVLSYQNAPDAAVGFLHAYYFDGTAYRDAEVLDFPFFSGGGGAETASLRLKLDDRVLDIEIRSLPPLTSNIPPQGVRLTRSAARFVLDGEEGGGVLERSLMPAFEAGRTYAG